MRMTLIAVLLLSGCAIPLPSNQTRIMFYSNPAGATITAYGKTYGIAPQQLTWTFKKGVTTDVSEPITATWVSGATTSTKMNLNAGQDGSYVMQRPQGVAGIDGDIQWAIHTQQQAQQQQQATDAAINNAFKPAPKTSTNCISNVIGDQVYTNCY